MGFTTSFAMAMHNGHIHRVYFVTYLATQTASLQPHGTSPSVHLTPAACAALEWRRSRNGKDVAVPALVRFREPKPYRESLGHIVESRPNCIYGDSTLIRCLYL